MKFLIFDVDRSLSSIGGEAAATKLSGFPPVQVTGGTKEFGQFMGQLFTKTETQVKHPLFDITGSLTVTYNLTPKATELGVQAIVLDTFSVLMEQDMFLLMAKGKTGRMDKQLYGELGENGSKLMHYVSKLPMTVIFLCHEGEPKETANGKIAIYPGIKGATKTECQRFFDVIMYIETRKDKAGKRTLVWLTKGNEEKFAKERLNLLDEYAEPDLGKVIQTYQKAGIVHPKILLIGRSGLGKTFSMNTMFSITN
jgi:hypothetical protein